MDNVLKRFVKIEGIMFDIQTNVQMYLEKSYCPKGFKHLGFHSHIRSWHNLLFFTMDMSTEEFIDRKFPFKFNNELKTKP